jgi:hypothetical protein
MFNAQGIVLFKVFFPWSMNSLLLNFELGTLNWPRNYGLCSMDFSISLPAILCNFNLV